MTSEWEKKSQLTKDREDRYYDTKNTKRTKLTLKELAKKAKSKLTTIEKAAKKIGSTDL